MLDGLFWAFIVPAIGLTLLSVKRGRRTLAYVERSAKEPLREPSGGWPRVALIVPVKGVEEGLASNLRSLAGQDYPRFELVICCASASEEALAVARASLGPEVRIVVAGPPPADTGEKVHNLLAAVEAVGDGPEVLAFADSDGEVRPDWLRHLVAPLEDAGLGAATGFRWHFPGQGGFWPLLRSVWDASIVNVMDTCDRSFAWGGATALRRAVFESAGVREHWQGALSDDYRLTDAMRAAGLGIRFVPQAMVATGSDCTAAEFLSWSVRQLVITRVHWFRMWLGGCVSHIFYCGGQLLCLLQVARGNWIGLGALLLLLVTGMAQSGIRAYLCALMFPGREEWLERFGWAYFWMAPVATWAWLHAFLRSGLTRRIAWRGRAYVLAGPADVRERRPA